MKYIIAPIATALFLLSGCDNAQTSAPQQPTPEVGVVTLQSQPVPVVSQLTGRTTASLSAEVRPQVGGIIQKRLFTEGDMVKAGQALYQIDPSSYRAAWNEAAAALKQARRWWSPIARRPSATRRWSGITAFPARMLTTPPPPAPRTRPAWNRRKRRWRARALT